MHRARRWYYVGARHVQPPGGIDGGQVDDVKDLSCHSFGYAQRRFRTKRNPFETHNRNKRSIVLDLKSEAGKGILKELAAGADALATLARALSWVSRLSRRRLALVIAPASGPSVGTSSRGWSPNMPRWIQTFTPIQPSVVLASEVP
ncbi:MAG: CoA transferase [Chloroflexi bacterium]|nr:CoA transferase [Chloroflexota bacterium]